MKKWYKRNFYFNELNKEILNTIVIYIICAGVTLFAYKKGIVIKEVYLTGFEINSINFVPVVPFILIYSILEMLAPIFLAFYLFWIYNKEFSNTEKIRAIIPVSNKRKVINMIVSILIFDMSFLIITYISNFNMGIREINFHIQKVALSLAILFCAIIIDILFREKKFNDIVRLILVGMLSFILFIGFTILFTIIEDKVANIKGISIILLIVFSVLEFIYILKRIDKIKIN